MHLEPTKQPERRNADDDDDDDDDDADDVECGGICFAVCEVHTCMVLKETYGELH